VKKINKKIILTLIITIIFSSVPIELFADNNDNIGSYIEKKVDVNGNITLENTNDRSIGAISVSGAVASSILALGVKAGFDYFETESMDEFLYRFLSVDSGMALANEIKDVISSSASNVLTFSRTLINSISQEFNRIKYSSSSYVGSKVTDSLGNDYNPLVVKSFYNMSSSERKYLVQNSSFAYYFTLDEFTEVESNRIEFETYGSTYFTRTYTLISLRKNVYSSADEYNISFGHKKRSSSSSYSTKGATFFTTPSDLSEAVGIGIVPVFNSSYEISNNMYELGHLFFIEYADGSIKFDESYVSSMDCDNNCNSAWSSRHNSYPLVSYVDPGISVVGESWSNGNISDDKTNADDISISIPKDTNELINVPPSGVVESPSYEIWNPGDTVVPPTTETPKVDVTPDVPVSDNPIVNWLDNFWNTLWEFLKAILIPSASYWIDSFETARTLILDKFPKINIELLEELAVAEKKFEDIPVNIMGVNGIVVKGSIINDIVGWARPIIQAVIMIFLLLYNYNQLYRLIRGDSLVGSQNTIDNMKSNKVGGRK
jgi:hypothetical protein